MASLAEYSVPGEAKAVFERGITNNNLLKDLPDEFASTSKHIRFEGTDEPIIPINWRFAESISTLKAFETSMLQCLIKRKYNVEPVQVTINTDHASLFVMSPFLVQIMRDGEPKPLEVFADDKSDTHAHFPNCDKHGFNGALAKQLITNIYQTKDGRFYHVHGSLNADPSLTALGLSPNGTPGDTVDSTISRIQSVISEYDAASLDTRMNEDFRQAGTIAYTADEYFATEHGKANSHVGLYEINEDTASAAAHPPSWWRDSESLPSSSKRPLAGLKVVDLCRIIAGPSITRSLAEMGASVMRITSPHVTDLSSLHPDLNWGKWNASLHLRDEFDKEQLRQLIREADVVVDGYRPGVMDRFGFSKQDVFDLVKNRARGIVHVRENCYGWHGPWKHRSGWQQISDACCGVSRSYAQAMGNDEAVTPVFPNSDYCTGVCGSTAVLHALIKRAEKGGNHGVDVALNYYSQWLVRSVGTYPPAIWQSVWGRHGSPVSRYYNNMQHTIPAMFKLLQEHDAQTLFKPSFFEQRKAENLGVTFVVVKPIAQFENGAVELKYNVGTRGNGADAPMWPQDLTVQVVA